MRAGRALHASRGRQTLEGLHQCSGCLRRVFQDLNWAAYEALNSSLGSLHAHLAILRGGDKLAECFAPYYRRRIGADVDASGHINKKTIERLHITDALGPAFDFKEAFFGVDKLRREVELVVGTRR